MKLYYYARRLLARRPHRAGVDRPAFRGAARMSTRGPQDARIPGDQSGRRGARARCIDGCVLTQNAAILNYLADQLPEAGLGGDGTPQARRGNTWLAFVNSDVHPAFKPLFGSAALHPRRRGAIEKARTTRASACAACSSAPTSNSPAATGWRASRCRRPLPVHRRCAGPARGSTWPAWTTSPVHGNAWRPTRRAKALKDEGLRLTTGACASNKKAAQCAAFFVPLRNCAVSACRSARTRDLPGRCSWRSGG